MVRHIAAIILLAAAALPSWGDDASAASRQALFEARPLKVLFNNDGGDLYRIKSKGADAVKDFLVHRHEGLLDKEVDVVCYTTQTSPVGITCAQSDIADTFYREVSGRCSAPLKELMGQGTDPLRESIAFSHAHGMMGFWGIRMNDCHDSFRGCEELFAPWKAAHPELLVGSAEERPPYAYWSALDFGRAEVREMTVRVLSEGMARYDVDGIDLDFCRHWCLFKSAAWGDVPSQEECDALTAMMRQIRARAEEIAAQRGRPMLILVRVMDSIDACRAMGIDLPRWCEEGLVDMVSGGSELRLNQPDYWAGVARRYPQVHFYMCQTEAQIKGENPILGRNYNPLNFRGQAAAAYHAGLYGIHAFNQYFPSVPSSSYLAEIDDPEKLLGLNKMYYFSQVFLQAARFGRGWEKFQTMPTVTPACPLALTVTAPTILPLYLGDEATDARRTLLLDTRGAIAPEELSVAFNGTALAKGRRLSGLLAYEIPAEAAHPGLNQVAIAIKTSGSEEMAMRGDGILGSGQPQGTWRRLFGDKGFVAGKSEVIQDGGYLLADLTDAGCHNLSRPLDAVPGTPVLIDFQAKVLRSDAADAMVLRIANGRFTETLQLSPEGVSLKYAAKRHDFPAADGFHRYSVRVEDDALRLAIDGQEVLAAPMATPCNADQAVVAGQCAEVTAWVQGNSLLVGSLSKSGTAAALFREMTIRNDAIASARLYDGALLVIHQPGAADLPAELMPLVEVPAAEVPTRQFSLRADALEGWQKSSFNNDNLKVTEGYILMDHRTVGPVLSHPLPDDLGPLLEVEFTMRALEENCPKGQMHALVVFDDKRSGGSLLAGYRIHKDGVQFLDDPKVACQPDADGILRLRIRVDTETAIADLYAGDAAEPFLRHRCFGVAKRSPQAVSFGDGSSAVIGRSELHWARVTEYLGR